MVDMIAIQQAVTGLQAAKNIVQALIGIHDAGVIKSKVIELQDAIMTAQSGALNAQMNQFTMLNRIRDLETQVTQMETWRAEKERYELTELGTADSRRFAYSLKSDVASPEPPHQICANCYNQGKKSILQHETLFPGRSDVLQCHACSATIYLSGGRILPK